MGGQQKSKVLGGKELKGPRRVSTCTISPERTTWAPLTAVCVPCYSRDGLSVASLLSVKNLHNRRWRRRGPSSKRCSCSRVSSPLRSLKRTRRCDENSAVRRTAAVLRGSDSKHWRWNEMLPSVINKKNFGCRCCVGYYHNNDTVVW